MIIHFEDNGQDFLWWKVRHKNGYSEVVDCGPFQSNVWNGTIITNASQLTVGSELRCLTPTGPIVLKHHVREIEEEREVQHG